MSRLLKCIKQHNLIQPAIVCYNMGSTASIAVDEGSKKMKERPAREPEESVRYRREIIYHPSATVYHSNQFTDTLKESSDEIPDEETQTMIKGIFASFFITDAAAGKLDMFLSGMRKEEFKVGMLFNKNTKNRF